MEPFELNAKKCELFAVLSSEVDGSRMIVVLGVEF